MQETDRGCFELWEVGTLQTKGLGRGAAGSIRVYSVRTLTFSTVSSDEGPSCYMRASQALQDGGVTWGGCKALGPQQDELICVLGAGTGTLNSSR